MRPALKLRTHLETPPPSDAPQWPPIERRLKRRKFVRRAAVALALLCCIGASIWQLTPRSSSALMQQGLVYQTAPGTQRVLQVSDTSVLSLRDNAAVTLTMAAADTVVLKMASGTIDFAVSRRPERTFTVQVGEVSVRVVGTEFTVDESPVDTTVSVERGVVEVTFREKTDRLTAGDRWSRLKALRAQADTQDEGEPASVASESTAPTQEAANTAQEIDARDEKPEPAAHRRPLRPRKQQKASEAEQEGSMPVQSPASNETPSQKANAISEAPNEKEKSTGAPDPVPTPAKTAKTEPEAAEVFASAMRARSTGKTSEAIVLFSQVAERWPTSAFAPMSAFEWGRLALDEKGDARQAARAFQRTLDLATSPSLIEDALARLVEASARFDTALCEHSRAVYLKRFPTGAHIRQTSKACTP
jgi:transmembrane sensor